MYIATVSVRWEMPFLSSLKKRTIFNLFSNMSELWYFPVAFIICDSMCYQVVFEYYTPFTHGGCFPHMHNIKSF